MNRPLQPAKFKKHLDVKELQGHWATLFQSDAKKADTAIWSLVHAAQDCVPFLKKHLSPAVRPEKKLVQSLIEALDSNDFKLRSKAQADLKEHAEFVLEELQVALKQKNSVEKQGRLEILAQHAQKAKLPFGTPQRLAHWRALEVLERIGSADARQLLSALAAGEAGAHLTQAAQAALIRSQPQ